MKNIYIFFGIIILSLLSINSFSSNDKGYSVKYTSERGDSYQLKIKTGKFEIKDVRKDGVDYSEILFSGKNITTKKKGWAKLPYYSLSVMLENDKNVDVSISSIKYREIELDHPVLPSRGVIYRDEDPDKIPYKTAPASIKDEWYPAKNIETSEPYILRNIRGENIHIKAFRYNAAKKKLRVATELTVTVTENNEKPVNPLLNTKETVNYEMAPVYESLFVNYQKENRWAKEIGEFGDILVIYTSDYKSPIEDWIRWKKQKGYKVNELQVSAGTNVVSDIQSAYDNNNNLLYVLLLGDWDDIKTDLGGGANAPTDPQAGCVAGGDDYSDLIVGRFSASDAVDITAQADKAINYEKNPDPSGNWYSRTIGIASDEGAGMGDDGESDQQHITAIHNEKLLNFTYTQTDSVYDPGATSGDVSGLMDNGVSLINYTGHGGHSSWVTSGYGVSDASSATNNPKLPFIFSVACVVGEFHTGNDCFAESLAKNPDGGALVSWMSTINQPWSPPMRGQDYANDLLIQGFDYSGSSADGTSTTYGRTTFGSIIFNAGALMVSESSGSSDWNTYKTWTIFGDPSVQVRTEKPKDFTITNTNVTPNNYETKINVQGNPFEGAIVSLWKPGNQPASAVTDAAGFVSINHNFTGNVKLTVTGFNLNTYSQDHSITSPHMPEAYFTADKLVIPEGKKVHFTDTSKYGPFTSWDWEFEGGMPSTSTDSAPGDVIYFDAGTYDVKLRVEDNDGNTDVNLKKDYITVVPEATEPPEADFIANYTVISPGETVNFHDLSSNTPYNWEWTFESGQPNNSGDQNPAGILYSAEGKFDVKMIAGNAAGTDTIIKKDYIIVSSDDPCSDTMFTEAKFTASNRLITQGERIYFHNQSLNYPANNYWAFEGGSPATSSMENPVNGIKYNDPGIYKVSLNVSNECGSDQLIKKDYIYVFSGNVPKYCDTITNLNNNENPRKINIGQWGSLAGHNSKRVRYYADYFENYSFSQIEALLIPVEKSIYANNSSYVWFYIWSGNTDTPSEDSILAKKRVYIKNIPDNYNTLIEFDEPVSINGPFYAGFKINYPDNNNDGKSDDRFVVSVAPDRGDHQYHNTMYVYKDGAWKTSTEAFNISTSMGIKPVACLVDIDEFDISKNIHAYPNPTYGDLTVKLGDKYRNSDIQLYLFDLTGRKININKTKYSETEFKLNLSNQSPGMYYLNIIIDGKKTSKKISVVR